MNIEQERAAFEAWGNKLFNYGFYPESWDGATEYEHEGTQMAWEGWLAATPSQQPVAQGVDDLPELPKTVHCVRNGLGQVAFEAYSPEEMRKFGSLAVHSYRKVLIEWAVSRWKAEVENRPLINKNRRSLDDTWRQVIQHLGGDTESLLGPDHDTLHSAALTKDKK